MKRDILPYDSKLKALAKKLRSNMTYSEVKLWNELKNAKLNGYDFDRQRAIGNYIVETHPCPSGEGMRPHKASFPTMSFLNRESLIARCSKRSALRNHPLPGGAKLMND